jgi:Raf kinase inhibitor-like YbhB/YbcL family protein
MRALLSYVAVALVCFIGCAGAERHEGESAPAPLEEVMEAVMITVTSSVFEGGERIPAKYTGEGEDVSPPLAWRGAPDSTVEFALICDDPDAPRPEPWVHWVLYGIPAGTDSLAEGATGVGLEGKTSWGTTGYGGPMPPPGHGTHHYHFKLYALDQSVGLEGGATKAELLRAMQSHVLTQGELVGTYER